MSLMGFALSAVATPAGFLVLLSAVLLLFFMSSSAGKRTGKGSIPGPFQLPFFGNLFEFMRNQHRFDDWLVDLKNQHGDTFQLSLPFKPTFVVTTNPKNVEHILKTNFQNYEKGPFFRSTLHDLLGNGIFNSDGDMWRPQRKITSNLFNVKHFREGMIHVFVDHSKMALDILEKSPQDLDVSDLFYRYTLDSIGCIAFGKDIKSLENPEVEFAQVWDKSNSLVTERFFTFSQTLRKLMPVEREIAQDVKAMNKFADEILTARKKENQESLAERFDLLSLFMSRKDESGAEFDDAYLRDMILNMVIAGRDTTAQSLAWTCYLLAQHPEAREKAKEEVDNVLGKDGVIDYDNLKQMEYLQAVVSESLRLYPSVPRDPHTCGVSDVLPTQHHVEAGSLVFYFSYGMGRSKEIWGEDCMEFKPERFYENPELATNTFTFTAFQGGPRTCLGQKMAYLEEKTILAMIFQKYDFELVPNQDVKIQLSLTLPMVNGLRLKFIPRG